MEIRETAGRVFIDNKRSSHQEIPPGSTSHFGVALLNCGSTTPLLVGWAVPLIQMSNQMLLSPVSKLGVWFNFPLWSCLSYFFNLESQRGHS